MNSKLYCPDLWGSHDPETLHYAYSAGEIRHLDPEKDKLLLNNLARNASGVRRKAALMKLGAMEAGEAPEGYTSDDIYDEAYWLAEEQVLRVEDPELLKRAAFEAFGEKRYFAFCRLTGYRYPAPESDAFSHRTFEVGRFPDLDQQEVEDFCREMIEKCGPFTKEAAEILNGK